MISIQDDQTTIISRESNEAIRYKTHNVTWAEMLYSFKDDDTRSLFCQIEIEKPDDIIDINIAGEIFQTYRQTLERDPDSLLGSYTQRAKYFNEQTGEFFFDRHIEAFEAILYYYQSNGDIYIPSNITLERYIDELTFYRIEKSMIDKIMIDNGLQEVEVILPQPNLYPLKKIWSFLEYPDTSLSAKVFAYISVLVILMSLSIFVLETVPQFCSPRNVTITHNATISFNSTTLSFTQILPNKNTSWIHSTNTGIIIWFTIEFLSRLISCPSIARFVIAPENIIDFLSILPYYMTFLFHSSESRILSVIRVIRVLRVLKLSRHSTSLQILGRTIAAAHEELAMFVFLLSINSLIFGSVVYYFEQGADNSEFKSILHAIWWAIVTLTTVGYGDVTPKTVFAKLCSSFVLVTGVILLSMPIPTVVSHFTHFAALERNRKQLKQS